MTAVPRARWDAVRHRAAGAVLARGGEDGRCRSGRPHRPEAGLRHGQTACLALGQRSSALDPCGPCLGPGLELALACNHRLAVARADTELGLDQTTLGLRPCWGGTWRLPRLIGMSAARSILFESRTLSGREAKRVGLVVHAFSERVAEAEVWTFSNRVRRKPPTRRRHGWFFLNSPAEMEAEAVPIEIPDPKSDQTVKEDSSPEIAVVETGDSEPWQGGGQSLFDPPARNQEQQAYDQPPYLAPDAEATVVQPLPPEPGQPEQTKELPDPKRRRWGRKK